MKIKIGPYLNYWGPYQISGLLQKIGVSEERCDQIGEWLAETKLNDFCQWVYDKRQRTVKIKIDRYDTWNMDNTLAHIIHPMLNQLKATKQGSPFVDNEDVPENLHSTLTDDQRKRGEDDEFLHDRWDYVLDEMIWAFGQELTDWESQFYSGEPDILWESAGVDENGEELFEMKSGPKDTFVIDHEGKKKHLARMQNGFRLFGKYYQNLWC